MKWISNNDPPLYLRPLDTWYNQKDKKTYDANIHDRFWIAQGSLEIIYFPKKTKVL